MCVVLFSFLPVSVPSPMYLLFLLQKVFEPYFMAFGTHGACIRLSNDCTLCIVVKRFPMELDT